MIRGELIQLLEVLILTVFTLCSLLGGMIISSQGTARSINEDSINLGIILEILNQDSAFLEDFRAFNTNNYTTTINNGYELVQLISKTYNKKIIKPFGVINYQYFFGVPVVIVDRIPWKDPTHNRGLYSKHGILINLQMMEDQYLEVIEHELGHSLVCWLRRIGIFRSNLQKDLDSLDFGEILNVLRDEAITYLIYNPRELVNCNVDLILEKLTGQTIIQLQDKLQIDQLLKIDFLAQLLQKVDGSSQEIRQTICQILLVSEDIMDIINQSSDLVYA